MEVDEIVAWSTEQIIVLLSNVSVEVTDEELNKDLSHVKAFGKVLVPNQCSYSSGKKQQILVEISHDVRQECQML